MRCPLCAQECPDDCLVCSHCRNDVRIPETLIVENRELKQQILLLRAELDKLQERMTRPTFSTDRLFKPSNK
jgi:hypothetical protein